MALVKCKECGKEMSDTVKKCPNCGYKEKKPVNKKVFIIIGVILVVLCVSAGIFIIKSNKPLTDREKDAVACISNYKSMLKNVDSLQVHDIRWFEKFDEDDDNRRIVTVYFDSSGQNGFGGNTRSIKRCVVHEDGTVKYTGSSDDEDSDNWLEQMIANIINKEYPKLKNDDDAEISVDRVMKEVNKK